MSVSLPFLRGGRPAVSNLNELTELLQSSSAPCSEWIWCAVFPRQWCHEARYNRTSAPVLHFLLGCRSAQKASSTAASGDDWHLLLTCCHADCVGALTPYTHTAATVDLTNAETAAASTSHSTSSASATITTLENTTTLLEVVDRLVQTVPTQYLPDRCTFVACVEGQTHETLGLFTPRRWEACVDAVRTRCAHRLGTRQTSDAMTSTSARAFEIGCARVLRDWTTLMPVVSEATRAGPAGEDLLVTPGTVQTLHDVLNWLLMSGGERLPLTKDASVPLLLTTTMHQKDQADTVHIDATTTATTVAASSSCWAGQQTWADAFEGLLQTVLTLNPLLWTATFCETDDTPSASDRATASTGEELKGLAKLRVQRDAARAEWRERVGHCATFSVPRVESHAPAAATEAADGLVFRHALLLQKPIHIPQRESAAGGATTASSGAGAPSGPFAPDPITAAAAMEGLSLSPDDVRPLPIAAQLHLFPDRGDAAYVASVGLHNTQGTVLDFHLDDYLHEDGEVLVQLGPIEGVPFEALDAFIARCHDADRHCDPNTGAAPTVPTTGDLLRAVLQEVSTTRTTATETPLLPPLCEGSHSRFMYPRVLFRKPTGETAKQNPLAKAHAAVLAEPPSATMLLAATRALSYLSEHVHAVAVAEPMRYTLGPSRDAAAREACSSRGGGDATRTPHTSLTDAQSLLPRLEPSPSSSSAEKRCAWCGRARERLLRCGGCRAVHYCCAAHQVLDWKSGGHKSECNVFLHAQAVQEDEVNPLIHTALVTASDAHAAFAPVPHMSAGWSCAASIWDFVVLVRSQTHATPASRPLCVHVVGVPAPAIDDILTTLSTLCASSAAAPPVRLLLCMPDLASDRRNEVWATSGTTQALQLLPETGVLGDIWRQQQQRQPTQQPNPVSLPSRHTEGSHSDCHGVETRGQPMLSVRLVNASYHAWCDTAGPDAFRALPLSTPVQSLPLPYVAPDATLLFGPRDGSGLTYLTAALELIATHSVCRCPVRVVDSSLVGSVRTEAALAARVANNDHIAKAIKTRVEAARHVIPAATRAASDAAGVAPQKKAKTIELVWDIKVNVRGFGPYAAHQTKTDKTDSDENDDDQHVSSQGRNRVPPSLNVVNGFFFDVPVSS